ncbi:hypothetical protein [Cumulibacter soli]|uniref:hypothetical protein n=1 Tax=Cumulibacter soli TaxID=2546344 RepID=UPI001067C2BF|nr:hypothetical protein [Cumulibacter soli]
MTITEASAVNVLLECLYRGLGENGDVDRSAKVLAGKAHKVLGAGVTPAEIDAISAQWVGGAK